MQVNNLTGEVTATIAGKTFRFHATMKRLAAFEAAIDVVGLKAMQEKLNQQEIGATHRGLKALCSSDNGDELDDILLLPHINEVTAVLMRTLSAGLPERPAGNRRAAGAKETPSPGRATAS